VLLYTIILFIGLLYFKIFRVRRQQEQLTLLQKSEGLISIVALLTLIIFGFMTLPWYEVLIALALSAVMASLIITTVQLGIFIDGKPLFKLSAVYRFMPILALLTIIGSVMSITPYYLG